VGIHALGFLRVSDSFFEFPLLLLGLRQPLLMICTRSGG
jgi:hypothetical protein